MKLYVVPHSHIDVEWYWTAQDMEAMLPQMFYDGLLPQMEQDEGLRFAQDQAVIWQKLLNNATPAQRQLILQRVQEGKLEPVGGNYVQPEVQEPAGESLIRQLQIGQKWMEENLGRRAKCAWHTDVFGQVNQLPQIFGQAGFEYFAFMRDINDKDDPEHFPTEFLWEGADGTKLLTHWFRISYVLCEGGDDRHFIVANIVQPENEEQELRYVFRQLLDEHSLQHKTGLAMLPWGGDVYALKENSDKIKDRILCAAADVGLTLAKQDIVIATPTEFFRALEEKKDLLEVKTCDFNPPKYRQDLRGTYITRVGLKQQNRRAEQALLPYEAMSACAGKPIADMDELWKPVLFGQFHDTIGGSCLDEAYTDAMERDEAVMEELTRRKNRLLGEAENGTVLNIFNPTQFVRTDVVTIPADGAKTVTTADGKEVMSTYWDGQLSVLVPDIGPYETVSLCTTHGKQPEQVQPRAPETAFYCVRLDPETGDLVSIFDKEYKRELLRGHGNILVAQEEKDPDMEGAMRLTGKLRQDDQIKAKSIRMEETPLSIEIVTEKDFLGFGVRKTVELSKYKKAIEFKTEILNYTGADLLLSAKFALNMDEPESIYETPFAVETGREGLYCAQKWAGLREKGFTTALLNQGNCAYVTEENDLSICLLRGHSNFAEYAKYAADRGLERYKDGKTHTELAAERGDHCFRYALCSTDAAFGEVSAKALAYNTPLQAAWSDKPAELTSVIRSVDDPFIVTKLYPTERGFCLRGYNASDKTQTCGIRLADVPKSVNYVNLLDEYIAAANVENDLIKLNLRPFEIVTVQIEMR